MKDDTNNIFINDGNFSKDKDREVLERDGSVLTEGDDSRISMEDSNILEEESTASDGDSHILEVEGYVLTKDPDSQFLDDDVIVWAKDDNNSISEDDDSAILEVEGYILEQGEENNILAKRANIKDGNILEEGANVLTKSWKAFSNNCFRCSTVIVTLLLLIISIFIPLLRRSPPSFSGEVNYICQSPQIIEPWQIKAFRPRWFGLLGSPGPIIYKIKGEKGHRISIVDMDWRDIEIAMCVDNKTFSHRPVVLNSTVSCGEDLVNCIKMGFGVAIISIPPGEHTIKAEIVDVDRTFRWGSERKRRAWWLVEECS